MLMELVSACPTTVSNRIREIFVIDKAKTDSHTTQRFPDVPVLEETDKK